VHIFVVVAKNRPDLYEYLRAGFAGVDGVEIIVDRRLRADLPGDDDVIAALTSQSSERRAAPDIYDQLEQRGFVIVRLPA
jgi:hypothetical protein